MSPRIGVMRKEEGATAGSIEFERVCTTDVTIGRNRSNTVVLQGGLLPDRFELMVRDPRTSCYILRFTDEMTGRISLAKEVPRSLTELKSVATSRGDGVWVLPLSNMSRGKVEVTKTTTVLFQMIRERPQIHPFRPLAWLGRQLARLPF